MLVAVVSPVPLAVQEEDLFLVGTVNNGKDRGKNVYCNTRFLESNASELFGGEDLKSTLKIISNELAVCINLPETLHCWFEPSSVVYLTMEEVAEFLEFYNLTKKKEMLEVLTTEQYDENASVAQVILLNGMDVLMDLYRKGEQEEEEGGN